MPWLTATAAACPTCAAGTCRCASSRRPARRHSVAPASTAAPAGLWPNGHVDAAAIAGSVLGVFVPGRASGESVYAALTQMRDAGAER